MLVRSQHGGNSAGDLRDLNGVGKPVAKMIGIAPGKNLRLIFQPAKRPGVDYAVAVTLKIVAIGVLRLRIPAPKTLLRTTRVGGPHGASLNELSNWVIL